MLSLMWECNGEVYDTKNTVLTVKHRGLGLFECFTKLVGSFSFFLLTFLATPTWAACRLWWTLLCTMASSPEEQKDVEIPALTAPVNLSSHLLCGSSCSLHQFPPNCSDFLSLTARPLGFSPRRIFTTKSCAGRYFGWAAYLCTAERKKDNSW